MTKFCEGCPMSNGVNQIDGETFMNNFSWDSDIGGFDILLKDVSNPEVVSNPVHAVLRDCIDSTMPSATFNHIVRKVDNCSGPEDTRVKRLGGVLGSKTIKACGAFRGQNPKKVKIEAQDSGWFNPADFI